MPNCATGVAVWRAKVDHLAVAVEEGVSGAAGKIGIAHDLAAGVDAVGVADSPAEGAEVGQAVGGR